LRALVVEREHPVVHAEVGHVPPGGRAATRDLRRDVEQGHKGQLHAAPSPRLMESEQARTMEIVERLRLHLPRRLGARRSLPERRHEGARPAHGFVITDACEAGCHVVGATHARIPAALGIAEYSSPPQSLTSLTPRKLSSMVRPFGSLRKIW